MNMVEPSYVASLLTGIFYGVVSWFPVSLEGSLVPKLLSHTDPNLNSHIVPAYLGMTIAVIFYFRIPLERTIQKLLRGIYESEIKFLLYASLFTLLIGYPRGAGTSPSLSPKMADAVSAVIGVLIILLSTLKPGEREVIGNVESRMRGEKDEPTLLDSIVTGSSQGLAFIGGLSRSGLSLIPMLTAGISMRKALELSFLLAPVYFLLKLLFIESYTPVSPLDSFLVFSSSFAASLLTMHLLLRLGKKSERITGLIIGAVALLELLVGVMM